MHKCLMIIITKDSARITYLLRVILTDFSLENPNLEMFTGKEDQTYTTSRHSAGASPAHHSQKIPHVNGL